MPRGGARPNSGPPKGTKYRPRTQKADKQVIKQAKRQAKESKKEQKKPKDPPKAKSISISSLPETEIKPDIGHKTPLQYMIDIMNDESADTSRRDRMAQAAAPYVHSRRGEKSSKKEDRQKKANSASNGRFATIQPPKLKAIK